MRVMASLPGAWWSRSVGDVDDGLAARVAGAEDRQAGRGVVKAEDAGYIDLQCTRSGELSERADDVGPGVGADVEPGEAAALEHLALRCAHRRGNPPTVADGVERHGIGGVADQVDESVDAVRVRGARVVATGRPDDATRGTGDEHD